MRCIDCGIEDDTIEVYDSLFEMSHSSGKILSAQFSKPLCKKCLHGNVYAFKGELVFMQEDLGETLDELSLYINHDYIDEK